MFKYGIFKTARKIAAVIVALSMVSMQTRSIAADLPGSPTVTEGQATFNYSTDSNQLVVDQQTDNVKISWNNFDICPTCSVVYQQPGTGSWAWNFVSGGSLSQILGSLSANGSLALFNPAGIMIGPMASIKAANFLAATLNIQSSLRNDSLQQTVYTLMKDPAQANSFIINKGTIQVTDGGAITLVGGAVQNEGLILAKLGKVNIASGEKVALTLEDSGLMSVAIDQPVTTKVAGVDSPIVNIGQIEADGGIVTLTAKTLKDVFQYAINNTGVIKADSLVSKNGEVYLMANDRVNVAGTISAEGGKVQVDSEGANYSGIIHAADSLFNAHDGDTYISGTFTGDKTWTDNFNIFVDGDLNVTGGDIFIKADNDNNGTGDLTQNAFTKIAGDGNITIQGANVTVGDIATTGDVQIDAFQGDVIHAYGSQVTTGNRNFRGNAANDYILYGGSSINAGSGTIDLKAGRDIYLGTSVDKYLFDWDYISGSRSYKFREFGYYVNNGSSQTYYTLSSGSDIGVVAPFSGSGSFTLDTSTPLLLYGKFSVSSGSTVFTVYQEAGLNADHVSHLRPYSGAGCGAGTSCVGFEDIIGSSSDYDFNDAVINIPFTLLHGATLSGGDIYLTAVTGGLHQSGGDIVANNLLTSTMTGMEGVGTNGGLSVSAGNISALNRGLGNILFDNKIDFIIKALTGKTGLNTGVAGTNGIENQGNGGKIDIISQGDLAVNAPVTSSAGDITLTAAHNISQAAAGDVTINQVDSALLNAPIPNVKTGDSHLTGQWQSGISNDPTIDMQWKLAEASTTAAKFTATAGGTYTMDPGSVITTNGGAVKIESVGNLKVAKIDAGSGNVSLKSTAGSILDNEPALTANIFARNIVQNAIGSVLATDRLSYPQGIGFVYKWNAGVTDPNPLTDNTGFTASFDSGTGDWIFTPTVTPTLTDSQNWYFNVATTKGASQSATGSKGAFWIDVTAPVISAGTPTGTAGNHGWWLSDVTVPFSATDNLAGFAPGGSTSATLASKTTSGEGTALTVTSDGITDRAGNVATVVNAGPYKVDKTAPNVDAYRVTAANVNGWNNTDVDVSYTAADVLSGIDTAASDTKPVTLSSEGADQSHTFTVYDLAGNSASDTVEGINIDKTAPVFESLTRDPAPNSHGWNNEDVTVDYTASDALSGLADGDESGSHTFTGEGIQQDHTFTIEDLAGNTNTLSVADQSVEYNSEAELGDLEIFSVNIDKTPPTIIAARAEGSEPNSYGWNNTNVVVEYDVDDDLSGVLTGAPSDFGNDTVTTEGIDQEVSGIVYDLAGNSASASLDSINIDTTPPTITAGVPIGVQNLDGTYSTDVTLIYSATDNLSGFGPGPGALSAPNYDTQTTKGPGVDLPLSPASISDLAGNVAYGEPSYFTVVFPQPPTSTIGLLGDQFRFKIPAKDFTQNYLISATQGPIAFVANQVFFYHPLTEVGSYEAPALSTEMYNFIDNNITVTNPALLPLQMDERKKDLPIVK
jgi:filamentous hemagglutinin family protein